MRILLWDIDGTLLKSGEHLFPSTHLQALSQVKEISFQKDDRLSGATDLEVILHLADVNDTKVLQKEYMDILDELDYITKQKFSKKKTFDGIVLPGVKQLLNDLRSYDFLQGIVTGNTHTRARLKLEASHLIDFFNPDLIFCGGHYESRVKFIHTVKNKLVGEDLILIGDSDRDITAAKKNGLEIIGVATGNFLVKELKQMNPELVISNLKSNKVELINFLLYGK
jgi:phosphoglycolate phosphatase